MALYDGEEIGRFIRRSREGLALSPAELAAMMGVTTAAVSQWENGSKSIDLKNIALLSDLFGVTIEDMLRTASPAYYNARMLYDFSEDFPDEDKPSHKKALTVPRRRNIIHKYRNGILKLRELIKRAWTDKAGFKDELFMPLVRLFDAAYEGEKVDISMLTELSETISCDSFIQKMSFGRDMHRWIFDLADGNDHLFAVYVDMLEEWECHRLLEECVRRGASFDRLLMLIRKGAVLRDAAGSPDFEGTLQLLRL